MGSLFCLISPQLCQQPCLAPKATTLLLSLPSMKEKGSLLPRDSGKWRKGCHVLCPGFAQPLRGHCTGLGTGEGFQSKLSDLKPPCESVPFHVPQSSFRCVCLCMGFAVSGVCVNGGCEKLSVLCQLGGLTVIFVCVKVNPRMSTCVSLSECVWMWMHLSVYLQLCVPDSGFACIM